MCISLSYAYKKQIILFFSKLKLPLWNIFKKEYGFYKIKVCPYGPLCFITACMSINLSREKTVIQMEKYKLSFPKYVS